MIGLSEANRALIERTLGKTLDPEAVHAFPLWTVARLLDAARAEAAPTITAVEAQSSFDAEMVEEIVKAVEGSPSGRFSSRQKVELIRELFSRAAPQPPETAGEDGPVAWLKEWTDNGEPRVRVDMRRDHEPWLERLNPKVTPLGRIAPTKQAAVSDGAVKALKGLYVAYVRLLEAGRDRIIDLGGTCDPVDRMEDGDPALIDARAALKALAPTTQEGGEG